MKRVVPVLQGAAPGRRARAKNTGQEQRGREDEARKDGMGEGAQGGTLPVLRAPRCKRTLRAPNDRERA